MQTRRGEGDLGWMNFFAPRLEARHSCPISYSLWWASHRKFRSAETQNPVWLSALLHLKHRKHVLWNPLPLAPTYSAW